MRCGGAGHAQGAESLGRGATDARLELGSGDRLVIGLRSAGEPSLLEHVLVVWRDFFMWLMLLFRYSPTSQLVNDVSGGRRLELYCCACSFCGGAARSPKMFCWTAPHTRESLVDDVGEQIVDRRGSGAQRVLAEPGVERRQRSMRCAPSMLSRVGPDVAP